MNEYAILFCLRSASKSQSCYSNVHTTPVEILVEARQLFLLRKNKFGASRIDKSDCAKCSRVKPIYLRKLLFFVCVLACLTDNDYFK